jgi:cytochrome c-type biogenesis protein CcmH
VIGFALAATAMVAVAVAWILVPLLRRRDRGDVDRDASNAAILRDQLAELDADLARGAISAASHGEARRELERRVLEEVSTVPGATAPERAAPWAAAMLAGLIPVAAVLLYLVVGTPEALGPQARAPAAADGGHQVTREEVEKMVADLAARLEKEPDNVNGWVVLARSYAVMNRHADAVKAYERVVRLVPNDPDLLADYADALAVTLGGNLSGKPLELAKRALAADPTHWKALALIGTEAFNRKDYRTAIAYWEKLRATAPPGSPIAQSIDASIAEARELAGVKPEGKPPAVATAPAAGRIAGKVDLSPALKAKVAPTDTVFVFARAAEGPRMPLAILRRQVKDLPIEFALDDSMAMAPNMKLSSFSEVVVGARVSRSGNATPQSGDLEGLSKPVKLGATGITVVIDSALP